MSEEIIQKQNQGAGVSEDGNSGEIKGPAPEITDSIPTVTPAPAAPPVISGIEASVPPVPSAVGGSAIGGQSTSVPSLSPIPDGSGASAPPTQPLPPARSEAEEGETGDHARSEVEGEVELPHQPSDIKPDEVIETEPELPESEKEQADEVIVAEEDKAPLPEVYTKGVDLPAPVSGQESDSEKAPSGNIPAPAMSSPAITRAHSEATDDFKTRFRNKLLEMLGRANEKRHARVEANEEKILAFAREHNRIDNQDVRDLTGYTDNWAREYLDRLEKQGKLVQFGQTGKNVFYKPVK